jgi:hypothetical protein
MPPAICEQLLRTYVDGGKECDRAKILGKEMGTVGTTKPGDCHRGNP